MVAKNVFNEGESFVIDAELYLTGKSFRYDPKKPERRLRPMAGQIRLGKEVSTRFKIECDRWKRYEYPLDTIFRLSVPVCKKSNETSFYDYFDEYYLRSYKQGIHSKEEYIKIFG